MLPCFWCKIHCGQKNWNKRKIASKPICKTAPGCRRGAGRQRCGTVNSQALLWDIAHKLHIFRFPLAFQPERLSTKQISGMPCFAPPARQMDLLGPQHSLAHPGSQQWQSCSFGMTRTSFVSSGTILLRFPSESCLIFASTCLEEQPDFSLRWDAFPCCSTVRDSVPRVIVERSVT